LRHNYWRKNIYAPFIGAIIDIVRQSFIDVPDRAYAGAMLGVYELNRIELLRDVFVWAYERSCQQYLAIAGYLPFCGTGRNSA